jgi:hypothetical protein
MTRRLVGLAAALVLVPAVAACGSGGNEGSGGAAADSMQSSTRCYELVEDSSRTVIRVEPARNANNPEGGQVTVYSYAGGAQEFAPETTAGRLEDGAFVYGDGTRLALTDTSLTWPQDSMLKGAVFTATGCP